MAKNFTMAQLKELLDINENTITVEKQKPETGYKNNEVVQNLIQQNTDMKEQIAELEDRHQRNNLRFMGIRRNLK